MTDVEKIRNACAFLWATLLEEQPTCPYCHEKMNLSPPRDSLGPILELTVDEDKEAVLLHFQYECPICEATLERELKI